jgi:hypothetical protein
MVTLRDLRESLAMLLVGPSRDVTFKPYTMIRDWGMARAWVLTDVE